MEKTDDFYLRGTIKIMSNKWALPVLCSLLNETKRYHEINRAVPDITQKVLTDMLHKLERYGFVRRVAYPTVPPKVEYTLTDLGYSFVGAFMPMLNWAKVNLEKVSQAQETYDDLRHEIVS